MVEVASKERIKLHRQMHRYKYMYIFKQATGGSPNAGQKLNSNNLPNYPQDKDRVPINYILCVYVCDDTTNTFRCI